MMVMQQVQLKYRLEKGRDISDGHSTGSDEVRAREMYLMVIQPV